MALVSTIRIGSDERELHDAGVRGLWDRLGLDAMDIDPGDVVAFLQQVDRYL